jgi:hypothetical protein
VRRAGLAGVGMRAGSAAYIGLAQLEWTALPQRTEEVRGRAVLLVDGSSALRSDFCDQLAGLLGRDAAAGLLASWSEAK